MGLQQFNELVPQNDAHVFNMAEAFSFQSIFPNTDSVHRLDRCWLVNREAYAIQIEVFMDSNAGMTCVGSVSVPAGIGTGGSKPFDLLVNLIPSGDSGIVLLAGQQVYLFYQTALSADGNLIATSQGGKL